MIGITVSGEPRGMSWPAMLLLGGIAISLLLWIVPPIVGWVRERRRERQARVRGFAVTIRPSRRPGFGTPGRIPDDSDCSGA